MHQVRRSAVRIAIGLAVMAAALVASPPSAGAGELIGGRFPTEETFVDQTYRDLLGRGPDAGGLAFWANEIRGGLAPEGFVEQLLLSPEFGGTIAPVVRLYSSVFGRLPDEGGLRFWVGERRSGDSLERLTQRFIAGAEFEELTAAATTEEVVAAVYGRSLGRTPDAGGLAFWTDGINDGTFTLERFIVEVSESPEHRELSDSSVLAVLVYLGLQQRTPEPGGFAFWTGQLDAGLPLSTFVANVLTLPEYQSRFAVAPTLSATVVAEGLTVPWDVESLPDGSVLATTRSGGLVLLPPGGAAQGITLELDDFWANGETGLMGLAVDPDFADNQRIYTCQGHNSPREIQVIAWSLDVDLRAATRVADPLVGGLPITTGRHGGCQLEFDREGHLFIGTGDSAVGTHPQNLGSLGGKVLRVDPQTGGPAPGNPFETSANLNQRLIWTYGHRNVQGLALRPETNEMWSLEHGPSRDDEVNRLVQPGGNAGWNPVSGYNESVAMTDTRLGANVFGAAWSTGSPTLAVSGGDWTNHPSWGAWNNALGMAALKNQTLRLLFFNDEGLYLGQRVIIDGEFGRLRAVHQAADGSLYITTSTGNDRIIRVTPTLSD